ncbi:S-layer homology domain-containing protein [Paenibacillus sp. DMB5]|uniref:S-layer homology domain-containing protein n=1 Tax=Paenibacillus sp. DMB5 TaxID=1780103 RepID=UPI00321FEDB9
MDITVSYNDPEGKPVTETVRTGVVAGPNGVMLNHDFTLPVSGTVKFTINNTYSGNQAALVSYVAIAKDKTSVANELAVNEAKSIIEGAAFNVKKAVANSEEAVQVWLQQTISGLEGLSETDVTIGEVTFTAFQEATDDAAGSFSFTVALSKGEALATGTASGTITLPEPDVTPPVITLNGDRVVNVKLGSDYTDAGATASDEVDGDLTDRIVTTVSSEVYGLTEIDTARADVYTFHYNVSDVAGNKALEVTRKVVVAEDPDTVKPVITLLGEPTVELANGAAYTDAGATAADDRDGDLTGQIIATITKGGQPLAALDTTQAGTYLYHYNVSDAAGNAAVEVIRTVIVAEKEPPVTEPTPTPTQTPSPTPAPTDAPVQTAPPVAATPTPTPAVQTVRTLEQKDIPAATDGAVTVQLAEGTESVVLPAGIQGLTGSNTLRLAWGNAAVEFTPDALKSIVEKAAAGQAQADQVRIRLTGLKMPAAAAEQLINNQAADSSLRLSAAGEVISFSLETVAADGTATKVTAFEVPLILTFNVNPSANPDLLGVYYIAGDGSLEYVGGTLKDGKMTAAVSHFSQYAVLQYDKSFADVSSSMWANSVIKSLAARHIIEGISAAEFAPQGQVTRAQFAAMIARALGLEAADGSTPVFRDVKAGAWYADSIAAVNQAGIVLGRTADTFVPDSSITREEMAVMVVRAYEYLQGDKAQAASDGAFSDQPQISGWAEEAVSIAVEAGLLQGRGSKQFAPQALMTRAESAQVIYNLLKQL